MIAMRSKSENSMQYSFIANTGIQFVSFDLSLSRENSISKTFLERFDSALGEYQLRIIVPHQSEDGEHTHYYNKEDLQRYMNPRNHSEIFWDRLIDEGTVRPLDPNMLEENKFRLKFGDDKHRVEAYEGVWLPLPYFVYLGARKSFEPLNWVRCKLIPQEKNDEVIRYKVILAVDTYSPNDPDEGREAPYFEDGTQSLEFRLCKREAMIMDYCSMNQEESAYIEQYLRKLAHPDAVDIEHIRDKKKLTYLASYILLVSCFAEQNCFPELILYRDRNVLSQDVDMIIDIGNSSTSCILSESDRSTPFTGLSQLQLLDYTLLEQEAKLKYYEGPFDMRITFRKLQLGNIEARGSRQFVYPSLVRVGREAMRLERLGGEAQRANVALSSYSSPKRYLWDGREAKQEWKFLRLVGEETMTGSLDLPLITRYLESNGRVSSDGRPTGNMYYRYARRSLMTFALLEMLMQARRQLNSPSYRKQHGGEDMPRNIKRILLTCPTTMSAVERRALVDCMRDACRLQTYLGQNTVEVEIVPSYSKSENEHPVWYYDEATSVQLVYLYSEIGHRYKGVGREFLRFYGKGEPGKEYITIGSLDIGAGTSDLMICKYSLDASRQDMIKPEPLFYDSFYQAGDDMLYELIRELFLVGSDASLRQACYMMDEDTYRQALRNFVGPDYNGQSVEARNLRSVFGTQVLVPVMYRFLELRNQGVGTKRLSYNEIFLDQEPSVEVISYVQRMMGVNLRMMEWVYNPAQLDEQINIFFSALINKVAAMMYAYECDIVLLSGRPASLSALRDLFLKEYVVAPNRLITLNNYHVGDWYPFGENTGHITNAKTIVGVGAMIGLYSSVLNSLPGFSLDTTALGQSIKSVVNYVEMPRQDKSKNAEASIYCFTPQKNSNIIEIHTLPSYLYAKKLDFETYPARQLFCIDFNEDVLRRNILRGLEEPISESDMEERIRLLREKYARLLPLRLSVERDGGDFEHIIINEVQDRDGKDLLHSLLEIRIHSLGAGEAYWLDNGIYHY